MGAADLILPLGVVLGAALAVLPLLPREQRSARWGAVLLAGIAVASAGAAAVRTRQLAQRARSLEVVLDETPRSDLTQRGFVGSQTCRGCHPGQYASWHASFHRTMTQLATPQAVVGDFDDVRVENRGRTYRLQRRGDEFWVEMVDPDWEHEQLARGLYPNEVPDPPRVWKQVVMTTGSHHQQAYWVASRQGNRLLNVPVMWLIDEQRWVPREDVFLRAPQYGRGFDKWNNNCIECHAVAGEPGHSPAADVFDSRVAELGIACEACHGPGQEHVRVNRDPLRRYRMHLARQPDTTIVHPSRLDQQASAEVCGQCHGMNLLKGPEFRAGRRYTAGGRLREVKIVLRGTDRNLGPADRDHWERQQAHVARQEPSYMSDRFWPDGMVRVSGREHNAMIESACYVRGSLTCLHCHSMHGYVSADDQLAPRMDGDEACLQCHQEYRDPLARHTRHRPGSSGAACHNCHMPHTTYGLLKAIRSHWIDSPSVQTTLQTGRPNACNLCHLDQTLEWTARHLHDWYGQPPVELDDDQRRISAALLWLLTGDAGQRALIAWHMGWPPAWEASGRTWMAPYLGHLLVDPYSAVRFIAGRSLRRLPGFENLQYDYLSPGTSETADARQQVIDRWMRLARRDRPHGAWAFPDRSGPHLLIGPDGFLQADLLTRLSRQRDDRWMDLRE